MNKNLVTVAVVTHTHTHTHTSSLIKKRGAEVC